MPVSDVQNIVKYIYIEGCRVDALLDTIPLWCPNVIGRINKRNVFKEHRLKYP